MSPEVVEPVVLFDGECGLCQWSVRWIVARDAEGRFAFAPLASPVGRSLLGSGEGSTWEDAAAADSVVVVTEDGPLIRSDALIAVLSALPGWGWAARLLGLVPRPLRDGAYRLVAWSRRRVLPSPPACPLPDPELVLRYRRARPRGAGVAPATGEGSGEGAASGTGKEGV